MNLMFPGWPGPAYTGRRSGISGVALPVLPPAIAAGGQAAPSPVPTSPFAGLAAHGVPVSVRPDGSPVLQAGAAGFQMPPQIAGMPSPPSPPNWMFTGTAPGAGLFQPATPVVPFHFGRYDQAPQGYPFAAADPAVSPR